ncbi:MAG: putative quinol monooxygenase [Acidimicrobiia bacterium]
MASSGCLGDDVPLGEYCEQQRNGGLVEPIQLTATLPNIAPGNLGEFKELAAQALELTKGEATTLQYDWFFSDDQTKCVVRETYQNSDAILAHMANLGDLIGRLAELGGGLEIEVFGAPSPQLLEAAAALQPTVYGFFQGK